MKEGINLITAGMNCHWFCIRSQQKREHIAAANLGKLPNVEVFNPRLRVKKGTTRGPRWFVESLFPNYLFARFAFDALLEEVKFTAGVVQVIHFGDRYSIVPDFVIEELKSHFTEGALQVGKDLPEPGDTVKITEPAFYGINAVVLRVLPSGQRVKVLLDMLGQTTMTEVSLKSVVMERQALPSRLLRVSA